MAYYSDFIQLQCISVTFGAFKSLPQHFGLFRNGLKFQNFGLGNGKSNNKFFNIKWIVYDSNSQILSILNLLSDI